MRTKPMLVAAMVVITIATALQAGVLIEDRFNSPKLEHRDLSPSRGEWKIADGVATCTQDDELFKKNKDHGPIIWYDTKFRDGTVRFAFEPQGNKTFVFTLNDDAGHVFRFIQAETGLSVRAWPEQGKDAKADSLLDRNVKTPPLADGKWTNVEVKFAGNKCTLTVGDFSQTFEHASIGKEKTKLGLGFSFGTLSLKDVVIETL